jgi:hypothetical protein
MKDAVSEKAVIEGVTRSEWMRRAITERLVSQEIESNEHLVVSDISYEVAESPHVPHKAKRSKDMWWL